MPTMGLAARAKEKAGSVKAGLAAIMDILSKSPFRYTQDVYSSWNDLMQAQIGIIEAATSVTGNKAVQTAVRFLDTLLCDKALASGPLQLDKDMAAYEGNLPAAMAQEIKDIKERLAVLSKDVADISFLSGNAQYPTSVTSEASVYDRLRPRRPSR